MQIRCEKRDVELASSLGHLGIIRIKQIVGDIAQWNMYVPGIPHSPFSPNTHTISGLVVMSITLVMGGRGRRSSRPFLAL